MEGRRVNEEKENELTRTESFGRNGMFRLAPLSSIQLDIRISKSGFTWTRLSEAFDGFFRGAFDASVPVTRTTDSAGTSRMEGTLSVAVEVGGVEEES
jgi:hypothetical protein